MATQLSEADTRAKLIDPALHARGWTEDLIRREETAGPIVLSEGGPRKLPKGRIDYPLRVRVAPQAQAVALALRVHGHQHGAVLAIGDGGEEPDQFRPDEDDRKRLGYRTPEECYAR